MPLTLTLTIIILCDDGARSGRSVYDYEFVNREDAVEGPPSGIGSLIVEIIFYNVNV